MQDTSPFKNQRKTKGEPKNDAPMLNAFIYGLPSVSERMLYSSQMSSHIKDRKKEMKNLGNDLEGKIEGKTKKRECKKLQGGEVADTA